MTWVQLKADPGHSDEDIQPVLTSQLQQLQSWSVPCFATGLQEGWVSSNMLSVELNAVC